MITIVWFEKGDCLLDGLLGDQTEVVEELWGFWRFLQDLRYPLEGWFANVHLTLRREDGEVREIFLPHRDQLPEKGSDDPPPTVVAVVEEVNQFLGKEVARL